MMMTINTVSTRLHRTHTARGSILIVGLLLLLVISLVTLATVSIPAAQLSLANNTALQAQSLAAAEDGLMRAETQLYEDYSTVPAFDWDTNADDCLAIDYGDNPVPPWCHLRPTNNGDTATPTRQFRIQYIGPAGLEMGNGTTITDRYYYRAAGHGEHHTGRRDVESIVLTTDLTQK